MPRPIPAPPVPPPFAPGAEPGGAFAPATPPAVPRPPGKLVFLEGLRGLAALAVLFEHLRWTFFMNVTQRIGERYGRPFKVLLEGFIDGNHAVWLFWVMSGFVLSYRFHHTGDPAARQADLAGSAFKRYPRLLLPVLASVLLAWSLHAAGAMRNAELAERFGHPYESWLGTFYQFEPELPDALAEAFWRSFFDHDPVRTYNPVLWTMEVELWGSFLLFSYLALVGRHPLRGVACAAFVGVFLGLELYWPISFVAGGALCDWYVTRERRPEPEPGGWRGTIPALRRSRALATAGVLPTLCLIGLGAGHGLPHLTISTAVLSLVLFSLPVQAALSVRPLRWLGKISFGLYLAHMPILLALAHPLTIGFAPFAGRWTSALLCSGIITLVSVGAGWLLWWAVDRPAVMLTRRVGRRLVEAQRARLARAPGEPPSRQHASHPDARGASRDPEPRSDLPI